MASAGFGGTDPSRDHKPAQHGAEHRPVGQISLNMGFFKQLVPGTSKGTFSYKSLLKIFIQLSPPSVSSPGGADLSGLLPGEELLKLLLFVLRAGEVTKVLVERSQGTWLFNFQLCSLHVILDD